MTKDLQNLLNETKENNSEYQDLSYDVQSIVDNIIDRVDFDTIKFDDDNITEELNCAIDDELIYYDDMWFIAQEFNNSPVDMNWTDTITEFEDILYSIVSEMYQVYLNNIDEEGE